MPVELISILYLGIGLLFVVLMGLAVQTIAERTKKLGLGKEKDAVTLLGSELDALKADLKAHHLNLLRPELDALKADLNALKTKLETATYSTKLTEHPSLYRSHRLLVSYCWKTRGRKVIRGRATNP